MLPSANVTEAGSESHGISFCFTVRSIGSSLGSSEPYAIGSLAGNDSSDASSRPERISGT